VGIMDSGWKNDRQLKMKVINKSVVSYIYLLLWKAKLVKLINVCLLSNLDLYWWAADSFKVLLNSKLKL
jgi:hypothetical protein